MDPQDWESFVQHHMRQAAEVGVLPWEWNGDWSRVHLTHEDCAMFWGMGIRVDDDMRYHNSAPNSISV
jgi:hypothetical protein